MHRSGETSFVGARTLGAVGLNAKHYALTSQGHPDTGIHHFGEQDFQLDECSDRRQYDPLRRRHRKR